MFYLKITFQIKDIQTDCMTSRLFYKGAAAIHFCCLLLLGAKQYFGDPIECDVKQNEAVDKNLIENYCWISATWTVKELYDPKTPEEKLTHPGVGVEYTGMDYTKIYHRYYQWIPTVLTIYIVSILAVLNWRENSNLNCKVFT